MKKFRSIVSILLLCSFSGWTGVFEMSIPLPDGSEQSLNAYQGKKLMIVVLPSTRTADDSVLLQVLDTLNSKYKDSVKMIGIPSYEDGFQDDSMYSLMPWYRAFLDSSFTIASGMNTRKVSEYQTPLFSYLTNADQNGYFDDDVYGAGEKFFINTEGKLSGISTPEAEFNEEIFLEMINK